MAEPKETIHDYDIIKQIGSGSFGVVYLVKANQNDQTQIQSKSEYSVMKQISLAKLDGKQRYDAHKEILLLSRLTHPNIVSYKHSFENDIQQLHIIMDYCDGGDLYRKINERKRVNGHPFDEHQLMQWFVQLCLALKFIHDRKILHRDLKTQNIFACDSDHVVKLGDFGIARILDHTADLAATCIGTPYYLSPEVCQNRPYGTKTDVWALGCVFYELSTFRHPFEGRHLTELLTKIVKGTYEPLSCVYSPKFKQLIGHMLKVNSSERPDVAGLLKRDYVYDHGHNFLKKFKRVSELEMLDELMKEKKGFMEFRVHSGKQLGVSVRRYGSGKSMTVSKKAYFEKKFRMYMAPAVRPPTRKATPRKNSTVAVQEKAGNEHQVPSDPVPTESVVVEIAISPEAWPDSESSRWPDQPKEEPIECLVQSLGSTLSKPRKQRKKWAALRPPPDAQITVAESIDSAPAQKKPIPEVRNWKILPPTLPSIPGCVDNGWPDRESRICETCATPFVVAIRKSKANSARNQCQSCKLAEKTQTKIIEVLAGQSVFEKIECLRAELESRLGFEKFSNAYKKALGNCAIELLSLDEESKGKLEKLLFFEKAYLN